MANINIDYSYVRKRAEANNKAYYSGGSSSGSGGSSSRSSSSSKSSVPDGYRVDTNSKSYQTTQGGGSSNNGWTQSSQGGYHTTVGGHDYGVDSSGNIYKNGSYVDPSNYSYIPNDVLNRASGIHSGSSSSSTGQSSVGGYSIPSGWSDTNGTGGLHKTVQGYDYGVDAQGNIYKNGSYVPATNYRYIPQEVLDLANQHHSGNITGGSSTIINGGQPSQNPFQNPMDLVNYYQTQFSQQQQQWQQQAQQEAATIAKQKQDALNSLIERLKGQQSNALQGVNNSVEDAKQGVEDNSFQQWLAARQAMANRGLAGSGLASDQDTRLLLAKQRNLSGIYRDAATRASGLNDQYNNQLKDVYNQLAGINQGQISSDLFNKYLQSGQDSLNNQFKSWVDMFNHVNPSGDNILDNQTDLYKYSNLSEKDKADLTMKMQQFGLDLTKVMGVDANGNPTLDMQKLQEQVRHNGATEQVSMINTAISQGRLNETIRANDIKAQQFVTTMTNNQLKGQANALTTMINQSGKQLSDLVALKKSGNGGANINQQIQNATDQYANYTKMLEVLQGLSQQSLSPDQAGLNYGNGSPQSSFSNFSDSKEGGGYSNYYKLKQASNTNPDYTQAAQAIGRAVQQKGVDPNWLPALLELAGRESSWNPTAQNPKSSAYGLFQFLDNTWKGAKTSDPFNQAMQAIDYIKGRYGTPQNALAFWDKNKWY